MALNYTCCACARALSRRQSISAVGRIKATYPQWICFRELTSSAARWQIAKSQNKAAPRLSTAPEESHPYKQTESPTAGMRLAETLQQRSPNATSGYVAYGATSQLFKECLRQVNYKVPQARQRGAEIPKSESGEDVGEGIGWWFENLKLPPTFSSWAQVSFLHIYLLTTRIRLFPHGEAHMWNQNLLNHFFYAAEDKMNVEHNITSGSIRGRYLKDLFTQYRGAVLSYDEGVMKGDANLAAAVWRNVFQGREEVDVEKLVLITSWLRREMKRLAETDDQVIKTAEWKFDFLPAHEANLVMLQSKMMKEVDNGGARA